MRKIYLSLTVKLKKKLVVNCRYSLFRSVDQLHAHISSLVNLCADLVFYVNHVFKYCPNYDMFELD